MSSSYPPQPDVTSPSTAPSPIAHPALVAAFVLSGASPLSANARIVYCALTVYVDATDREGTQPSIATLAGHTGSRKHTAVEAGLEELETVGIFVRKPNGKFRLLDTRADLPKFIDANGEWIKSGGAR